MLISLVLFGVLVFANAQPGQRGKAMSEKSLKDKKEKVEKKSDQEGENVRAKSDEMRKKGKTANHKKDSVIRGAAGKMTAEEREARREERVKNAKERKETALKKLEEQKLEGKITEEQYAKRKNALDQGVGQNNRAERGFLTPEQREQKRIQRMEKAKSRTSNAKSKLEEQKNNGEITEEIYQKRLEKLNQREEYLQKINISASERANWTKEEREAHVQMRIDYNKNRIAQAKEKLNEKKAKGEIDEEKYNQKMERLNAAEKKLNRAKKK